jgi:ABC-type multidrug transport system fused ATPase/permease subunit
MLVFALFALLVIAIFNRKAHLQRIKAEKHRQQLMQLINEPKSPDDIDRSPDSTLTDGSNAPSQVKSKRPLSFLRANPGKMHQTVEVCFENVGCKVGRTQILQNVSGKLSPGRTTAIMGPSGAGKVNNLKLNSH